MSEEASFHFSCAVSGFCELVDRIGERDWDRPGLGEWDIRSLVGHASRSMSGIESYLGRSVEGPFVDGPVAYFHSALSPDMDETTRAARNAAIAQRGREAGAALGPNPAAALHELSGRVLALVGRTGEDEEVGSAAGPMTFGGFLPTRTFELAVHSIDVARALGLEVPDVLMPPIKASCILAGRLAAELSSAPDLLSLLTGRSGLPVGLSVF
ncbi:MAG: maleylpyruvate isomerase N-terminal domain-containing protein [Acidimicrobiales bacterium]